MSGRLLVPVTIRPLFELSKRASTASWSIRFSFLMMISGAFSSINLFSRLFLLMTRRYRSFRSDVANLPPSRGTSGLKLRGKDGYDVEYHPVRLHAGDAKCIDDLEPSRQLLPLGVRRGLPHLFPDGL